MKQQRICIYAKDIQRITGKSLKTGHRIPRQLRKQLGKQLHQFVFAKEFADLNEETVLKYLDLESQKPLKVLQTFSLFGIYDISFLPVSQACFICL